MLSKRFNRSVRWKGETGQDEVSVCDDDEDKECSLQVSDSRCSVFNEVCRGVTSQVKSSQVKLFL